MVESLSEGREAKEVRERLPNKPAVGRPSGAVPKLGDGDWREKFREIGLRLN
jgi:hypothetical protein